MRKSGPFRPVLGPAPGPVRGTAPATAIALSLVLGLSLASCAQVEDAFQQAGDELGQLFDGLESSNDGSGSDAGIKAAARTDGPRAPRTSAGRSLDGQYQDALAARARGDDTAAFKGFRKAASKGHAAAAYETSQAYFDGRGVKTDRAKGLVWLDRGAALGDSRAQHALGKAYFDGEGVEQDEPRAITLLTDAATQGHPEAQYLLGEAYSSGRGVPKNGPWAARWYGKAAHQGLPEALYAYGLVHARGLGLPVDRTEGHRWLLLAARAGHERAEVVRRALETKMAPEVIKLSEVWADRFQPKREQPFTDNPTVKYVQQVLNTLGYEAGPVDGQPGKKTSVAVRDYQKSSGMRKDGRISPGLVDRLLAEQAKAP